MKLIKNIYQQLRFIFVDLVLLKSKHKALVCKVTFLIFIWGVLFFEGTESLKASNPYEEAPIYQWLPRSTSLPITTAPTEGTEHTAVSSSSSIVHPEPTSEVQNSKFPTKIEAELPLIGDPIRERNMKIKWGDYLTDKNCFQINACAASFSTRENKKIYDYYHIALEGLFTPDSALHSKSSDHIQRPKPIFVHKYEITAKIVNNDAGDEITNIDPVFLIRSSPATTEGETKYTSSIEFGLEGKVGFSGAPTGETNLHLVVTHSRERVIKDVIVRNLALTNGYQAKWIFVFNNLDKDTKMSNVLSFTCFQPYVQWLWRVDRDASDKGIYVSNDQSSNQKHFKLSINLRARFGSDKESEAGQNKADRKKEKNAKKKLIKATADEKEQPKSVNTSMNQEKIPDAKEGWVEIIKNKVITIPIPNEPKGSSKLY